MLKKGLKEDGKNKLLPYSQVIDEEAFQQLQEIKTNLGLCILLRELRHPLQYWTFRLKCYIDLYGLKMSKKDHILFIQLFYDLITAPEFPLDMIKFFVRPLRILLKKKTFLTPQDLTLPWKPLYTLCKKVFSHKSFGMAPSKVTQNMRMEMEDLVLQARYYFDPKDTLAILDELRPFLCPSDVVAIRYGVKMLSWFLPISSSPEMADETYKLWFEELLRLWDACNTTSLNLEDNMMYLMSRLSLFNTGAIDWHEYIPSMYSKILRIFKLPVSYKKKGGSKLVKIMDDKITSWIVSTLGGGSISQDYLDQLLKTLESYCHPANTGTWIRTIKSFLSKLSSHFVLRVKRERYWTPFWQNHTPENKKLTDDDITRFVVSMQSITMSCIYSPVLFTNIPSIFHELATLRPDLVIPPLLDRLYDTINCVTEPHKLTALLQCIQAVARPMLTKGLNSTYEDGKKHVIPLLFAVLPGIDPNDQRKSYLAFQLIDTFLNMIPVVDCSSCCQFTDLTEVEKEVANQTSQFEDFVLRYMERIFNVIENIAHEIVRIENYSTDGANTTSMTEKSLLAVMESNFDMVFGHISPPIFTAALKKMYNYSMMNIFERKMAGRSIAVMLKAFASINGEETYKLFIPTLCSFILEAVRNSEVKSEEQLDNELLFKMLLLSEIVRGCPITLKQYIPLLVEVLDETLHLKCKEGYETSNRLLANILYTYSHFHPLNFHDKLPSYDSSSKTFPVRKWGVGITMKNLDIEWYCPGEEEIALVEQIFWKYLLPELEMIDKYSKNQIEYSRDDMRRTLQIIISLFTCYPLLNAWNEEPFLTPCESRVPFKLMNLHLGIKRYIRMPDGSNVYKVLIEKISVLQSKLLLETDDTVSFAFLTHLWSVFLYNDPSSEIGYYIRREYIKKLKKTFRNPVGMNESNMRRILTEEVCLKHVQRILYNGILYTETHKVAFKKLLDLATCDYKLVQASACYFIHNSALSYCDNSCFIDGIVENLQVDTVKYTEKFKGALSLLIDKTKRWYPLFTQSYSYLNKVLPAVIESMPSEELTVISLISELVNSIPTSHWQFAINFQIPENVINRAKQFWTGSEHELLSPLPDDNEIKIGEKWLENENKQIEKEYRELIQRLMDIIRNKNLNWRYEIMAAISIVSLYNDDIPFVPEVVAYFLKMLIHDTVSYRSVAGYYVPFILQQYKLKSIKEVVDPLKIRNEHLPTEGTAAMVNPGPRPDNQWCRYKIENVPKDEKDWNEARYTYQCYLGFYCWPKEVRLCSSPSIQPMNLICSSELSGTGNEIDAFFTSPSNINKLIEYFSLEEIKGEPMKNTHILLFKYLFKIHGNRYLKIFKPELEGLLQKSEESKQRCAAELFAGILMGSKLWPYEETQELINWCMPLLRKAFDNMTVESERYWRSAMSLVLMFCDVNKSSYLLDVLIEKPIKGNAAFKDCGRLHALQSGARHSWRLSDFWNKLLEYIKPHLANDYQNLRMCLGSLLFKIFETDIETENWNRTLSPHVTDFMAYLLPKFNILYSIAPNSLEIQEGDDSSKIVDRKQVDPEEEQVQEAIKLFKTVCNWVADSAQKSVYSLKPDFFKIFPLLCSMENYDKDDELKKCCQKTLSNMSLCMASVVEIPIVIEALEKVSQSNSWCAKCTAIDFFLTFSFHNLFVISSRHEWIKRVLDTILQLLIDNRCEVRIKAGEVVSGFVHYDLIKDKSFLLKMFTKYSSSKKNINIRHAGVIGLCAIISAYPYTIPPEIPCLCLEISNHLKDSEPIPTTIRKTLGDFKRTHSSDWEQVKQKFTVDQFDVFSDMAAHNYYA